MFIRFVVLQQDEESHSLQGVFQAAYDLRDEGDLEDYEREWLETELEWLKMHLKSPDCLGDDGNHRAICWFKPDAHKPIDKVRSIVTLLVEKGINVHMLKSDNPGSIIYEDGWQIVAKPWRETRHNR